jgi:peptidoglycan/LPS O-acetylase OafA/YrhL
MIEQPREQPAPPEASVSDAARDSQVDAEIERVRVPIVVRGVAALDAVAGLVTAVYGFQIFLLIDYGWERAVPFLFIALGVGGIASAAYLGMGRHPASWASAIVNGAVFVVGSAWFVYLILTGAFSCLGLFVPPIALAAAVASPFTIKPSRDISLARKRLQKAGLALGF